MTVKLQPLYLDHTSGDLYIRAPNDALIIHVTPKGYLKVNLNGRAMSVARTTAERQRALRAKRRARSAAMEQLTAWPE